MTKANSTYKQNILKLSQKLNKIRANLVEKRSEYAKLSSDPDQDASNINNSSGSGIGGSPSKALPEQTSTNTADPTTAATIAAPATQSSTSVNSNSSTTSNTTSSNNAKSKLYALSVAVGSVLETSLNVTSSHTTSYTTSFTTSQERKNRLESRINELEEQEREYDIQLEHAQIEYSSHINIEQNDCIYIIQSSSRHLTEELIQVNAMMNKVRLDRLYILCILYVCIVWCIYVYYICVYCMV